MCHDIPQRIEASGIKKPEASIAKCPYIMTFYFTLSANAFPALNFTTFLAGILIAFPV